MTTKASNTLTDQKVDADGNPIGPDVMPDPIEDEVTPEPRAETGEPAGDEPSESRRERKQKPKERDRREEIAQMYRQMRSQQATEDTAEPAPAQETVDTIESTDSRTAPETADQTPPNGVQNDTRQDDQDIEIELKIDGQTVRKPLSEVKKLAQMAAAGEIRLDKAKELVNEAKTLRDQWLQQVNQPATQQDPSQTQQTIPGQANPAPAESQAPSQTEPGQTKTTENPPSGVQVDRQKLRQIAGRLQVGDDEEGAQALEEYTIELITRAQASQPSVDPAQISTWVRNTVLEMQSQAEADAALQRFAEKYKPLATNEELAMTATAVLRRELVKDLKQLGARDEDLAAVDPRTLAHWHRIARQTHRNLRSYDQILTDVGDHMVKTFNIKVDQQQNLNGSQPPANQQQRDPNQAAQERQARLRTLPSQPRAVNVRTPLETGPRPKTKTDILNEYRKSRGFQPVS